MRLPRLAMIAASAAMTGISAAQAATMLAPHRAVYDLELDQASDRSGITGIRGRMVYEFEGSPCDGYTVNFRFVTRIDTPDVSRLSDIQTSSYEDGEGKTFDFVTKSFVDQTPEKEVKGTAHLDEGGTDVALVKPDQRQLELGKAFFPTQHLLDLIARAEKSENFYEARIFDGSEDADKVMTTTVVIGRKSPVRQNDPERNAMKTLADDQFWPVEMAYFDLSEGNGEEIPSYRISFKLHENGVTRDLVMDYGDFSMKGTLVDLALLDRKGPACDR